MRCLEQDIEIYFDDLSPAKQAEIIEKLGGNGNYDVMAIAVIPLGPDDPGYQPEEN